MFRQRKVRTPKGGMPRENEGAMRNAKVTESVTENKPPRTILAVDQPISRPEGGQNGAG